MVQLNDVHSRLNPSCPIAVIRPQTLGQLADAVRQASTNKQKICAFGGRHAMGGQQFIEGGIQIDATALTRVISKDCERGLIEVEAGIMWPALIEATHSMPHPGGATWAIKQKQTGVDDVTLGGSVSAAAHGRGLLLAPISEDVESLTVVNASGEVVNCSRTENTELFSLVCGGYGLFGIIYSVTLRLMQRQKLVRVVDVIELEDAGNAIYRRIDEGCTYGDFQYAIDHTEDRFMRKGVFACYRPAPSHAPDPSTVSDLPRDAWLKLLALAHTDKTRAFKLYAGHYLQSDGNVYWSDTMQLSTYIPSYAEFLKNEPSAANEHDESLVIGEHYVPPDRLLEFMQRAREILYETKTEVIYGTLRLIQPDTTSFLAWARKRFICTIFNLRTPHTDAGIARTRDTFQLLTEASIALGGSFFLTYHRYATAEQIECTYPNIREFFAAKRRYDVGELFQSNWYRQYREYF